MRRKVDWNVLVNFNDETRNKVIAYMHEKGMSLNQFSKECNVGQPNLHVFVNGKTLAVKNLERIWQYFDKVKY